jgi:ABC-type branched-subunit amino acid transport system substrate-binding protein
MLAAHTSLTPAHLQQALTTLDFQGASGRISFGPDGNSQQKAVAILHVDTHNLVHLDKIQGQFLLNGS